MEHTNIIEAKQSKIGSSEFVTEALYTTPHLSEPVYIDGKLIDFGNSGFDICVYPEGNNFDFMPEGQFKPEEEKAPQNAMIYCAALYELYNFLNSPDKLKELGLEDSNLKSIAALTNTRLIEATLKLFSKSNVANLITTQSLDIPLDINEVISINLEKFKNLGDKDPLISYLKKVTEKTKGILVSYWKPILK